MGEYFIQGANVAGSNAEYSILLGSNSHKFMLMLILSVIAVVRLWQPCCEIFETVSQVAGIAIKPVATAALVGSLPLSVHCPGYEADFVAGVSLLARRLILLHWKSSALPNHSLWIKDIFHFTKKKIPHRYSLKGSVENL